MPSYYTQDFIDMVLSELDGGGSIRGLSKKHKVTRQTIRRWDKKRKLADDNDAYVQEGHLSNGTTALYAEDGRRILNWVKTKPDEKYLKEAKEAAIRAMCEKIEPVEAVAQPKKNFDKNLLSCYILTDFHIGMMAWDQETGDNWDLSIAEGVLINWFRSSIKASPDSHTAILANIGDFLHYDGLDAVTPTSGHVLDADSRLPKIIEMTIRVIRQIVAMLLEKHKHVHIMMAEGNHDLSSSAWMRAMFDALYENEKRVTVDNTHTPYYAFEWGDTSLFFHHGHKRRIANISELFAAMFRDMYGRTKYSYAHLGHLHHKHVKEDSLMIVEQHPTLAAKDAHASRGGYLSNRAASLIIYHKNYGEVSRITTTPEML